MSRHSIRNLLHISGVWGSNFSYQLELQNKIRKMTSLTQLVLGISTNSIVLKLNNKGNKRQNVLHNKIITISPSKKKSMQNKYVQMRLLQHLQIHLCMYL